ncbi:probable receptor-like protein kinase, partial [Tanacetum coccineum]
RIVIHGDVKSSNIVLDAKWEAKVCDFGLAKIADADQISVTSQEVSGTHGYVDPSYQVTKSIRKDSDVYSLGVTLFEVLCGRASLTATLEDRWLTKLVETRYKDGRSTSVHAKR